MAKGGIGNIMKQAQQMQRRMAELQEELESKQVEASSGGGMVTAVVSGKQQLLDLKIDPTAVDPEDVEMLEDMVLTAVSEAIAKSQEAAGEPEHTGRTGFAETPLQASPPTADRRARQGRP